MIAGAFHPERRWSRVAMGTPFYSIFIFYCSVSALCIRKRRNPVEPTGILHAFEAETESLKRLESLKSGL